MTLECCEQIKEFCHENTFGIASAESKIDPNYYQIQDGWYLVYDGWTLYEQIFYCPFCGTPCK